MCQDCYICIKLENQTKRSIEVYSRETSLSSGKWCSPGTKNEIPESDIKWQTIHKGESWQFAAVGEGESGTAGAVMFLGGDGGECAVTWKVPHGNLPGSTLEMKDCTWDKWKVGWTHLESGVKLADLRVWMKDK